MREKSRVQSANGFDFACHLLKNWREFFKPITTNSIRTAQLILHSFDNGSRQAFHCCLARLYSTTTKKKNIYIHLYIAR